MNRSQRRRLEKENSARRMNKILADKIVQDIENERVEALMLCFTLALHEEFGFGKERCLRALQRIDSYMGVWVKDKSTLAELSRKVKDEVGISIEC